jgi:hypothetical protein
MCFLDKILYNRMKTHFEFYSGVTREEIGEFLKEKGLKGEWVDKELNVFKLYDSWTMEDWHVMHNLCRKGFELKGVQVRGTIMVPPPPELKRLDSVA